MRMTASSTRRVIVQAKRLGAAVSIYRGWPRHCLCVAKQAQDYRQLPPGYRLFLESYTHTLLAPVQKPPDNADDSLRGIYTPSAMRTSVMLVQPKLDAVIMKPMLARKHRHFGSELHSIHANRTFSSAFMAQHFRVNLLLRQGSNSIGRSWRRCATVGSLINQLRDDPV